MADKGWIITVVDTIGKWQKAPAADLVRRAGISLEVAARWKRVRREMSPAGLKRKAKEYRN
jgi:uncharacterized protein (DUF2384 family)